ncbi:MAG: ABC transporter ATP-binding protein [Deltaproteobacteria bacterium]
MSKPIIEVTNISKKFTIGRQSTDLRQTVRDFFSTSKNYKPEIWALKDINFTVEEGEVLGLIGPNGSGKSTLLKILSRITYPTTGKAVLRGRVSSLLEVGTGFHPELTGRENIFLNGSILGMKKAEIKKKFDEIVDFSGVEHFIDTPVKHFSSGMYVRLAFSVAAHLEPEILLVDEVLSVGDLEFRQKSMGKMNEVAKQGRTVIFVSHDVNLINKLCSNGLFLYKGGVISTGTIESIINDYSKSILKNYFNSGFESETYDFIKINEIEVFNSNLRTQEIRSGDDMMISFNYILKESLLDPVLRFEIRYQDLVLFVCNNILSGERFTKLPHEGKIICVIPKIPLNVGEYLIDFYIEDREREILNIRDFIKFKIIPGDFYKTSRMPGKNRFFLVNHHWKVE